MSRRCIYRQAQGGGFTLIELIVVIVVMGIALLGFMPVFNHVLSAEHRISESHQGQLLVQERMSQVLAARWGSSGFTGIIDGLFADESAMDLGGAVRFDRKVEIQGAYFATGSQTLSCSGSAYNNEDYKCVIVTVSVAGEGSTLARRWTMFAR